MRLQPAFIYGCVDQETTETGRVGKQRKDGGFEFALWFMCCWDRRLIVTPQRQCGESTEG